MNQFNSKKELKPYDLIELYRRTQDPGLLLDFYKSNYYSSIYGKESKQKWRVKYEIIAGIIGHGNHNILDVGCATRSVAEKSLADCGSYYGFDINEKFTPDYIGDAHNIAKIVDRRFDWVILSDILEHLHDPYAVLRSCSYFASSILVVVPQWYHLECLPIPSSLRNARDRHLHTGGNRFWVPMVRSAGFNVRRLHGFWFIPSISYNFKSYRLRNIDNAFDSSRLLQGINSFMQGTLASIPGFNLLGQELVIEAEVDSSSRA